MSPFSRADRLRHRRSGQIQGRLWRGLPGATRNRLLGDPQLQAITEACRRHRVARLHAFGSVLRPDYRPGESDIDLLVEFQPCDAGALYRAYFALRNDLHQGLQQRVDLVMADAVRNPIIRHSIETSKQTIYEA